MSNTTRKPSHRLIRYYGTGKNAPRSQIGAMWTNDDGSFSVRIDTLTDQIWINAFAIEEQGDASQQTG